MLRSNQAVPGYICAHGDEHFVGCSFQPPLFDLREKHPGSKLFLLAFSISASTAAATASGGNATHVIIAGFHMRGCMRQWVAMLENRLVASFVVFSDRSRSKKPHVGVHPTEHGEKLEGGKEALQRKSVRMPICRTSPFSGPDCLQDFECARASEHTDLQNTEEGRS